MAEPTGVTVPHGTPQYQFNGINSSNSSRGSSPAPKAGHIPISQLPGVRSSIPASQLPPSRSRHLEIGHLNQSVNRNNIAPQKIVLSDSVSSIVPNYLDNVPSVSVANKNVTLPRSGDREFSNPSQFTASEHFKQATGNVLAKSVPESVALQQPQVALQTNFTNLSLQQTPTVSRASNQPPIPSDNFRVTQNVPPYVSYPQQVGLVQNPNQQSFTQVSQGYGRPSKPRYPQTIPSKAGESQSVTPGLPHYNQFNTGPVQKVNYNATPVYNTNGPSLMPPSAQNQAKSYPVVQQQFPGNVQPPQGGGVIQTGFNKFWGMENCDLLQLPNILPPKRVGPPEIKLGQEALNQANCSGEVFRCTVTKIPESASLLQKSRLPLGLLIHPFKDLSYLPVIQCNVIVRCRSCRTYINPFVYFVDSKRWKCNLCYRVNELPEEFQYDPVSKTYGDPSRRPEIKSSTIEYIAPAEYMLRPPQPAVYLFLLDVSRLAIESGYLEIFCGVLLEELKNLPGDARTQIGFIAYDSAVHFFSLAEGLNQPHEMTVLDIDDVFLPTPDNLLVNLKDRMELVEDLLNLLPKRFGNTFDGNSALGASLQVAHKLMGPTGGRVTVFQASLCNVGPGALTPREDPNQRNSAEVANLNPANDFYKRLALEYSGHQVAVDLFVINSQYVDIGTISGISRFSGGCIHHFPLFKSSRLLLVDGFQKALRRYLVRKIGFEAVMRVRCTRGLSIHTFHGNFFVRSTDLLSLPNINPDAAFGMQVTVEENLSDCQSVCFQAALLYTSSKGERRIRVHTLCLPIAATLHDVINSADQQCIIGLLGKMAVDRSMQSSLSDAREAFINAAIDSLTAYKFSLNMGSSSSGLIAPECLKLLPLYISAILKHPAFRIGTATRLDDRVKAMIDMKTKPLHLLIQQIYPDMYPIHNLESQEVVLNGEEEPVPMPPRLQLTARCLENKGAFLMDCGDQMIILVCPNVPKDFLNEVLGVTDYGSIPDNMYEVPILENLANQRFHLFINYLNEEKPYILPLQVIKDNNPNRVIFLEKLIEDRLENSLSYHEFLQHLKTQVK